MTDRNPIPWQLSHMDHVLERAELPLSPTNAAFNAAREAYEHAARSAWNRPSDALWEALRAAYAVDGRSIHMTDQGSAEAASLDTLTRYHGANEMPEIPAKEAKTSALRTILKRANSISMGKRGFVWSYVKRDELDEAIKELTNLETLTGYNK